MPEVSKYLEESKTVHVSGKQELLEEHVGIFMSIKEGSWASLWDFGS